MAKVIAMTGSPKPFFKTKKDFLAQLEPFGYSEGKMKKKVTHVVPLSDYVLEILEETRGYSGLHDLVFPSHRSKNELSNGTFNYALKKISNGKYKVVGHSFRGIFSTIANNNLKFDSRVIDVALAHSLSNEVEKAYNRADYLDQRRDLMQWWTDYLLKLKTQP